MIIVVQGHSGEESDMPLVKIGSEPKNEKDRLQVLKSMHAHAQFCMSGDHTLSATVQVSQFMQRNRNEYGYFYSLIHHIHYNFTFQAVNELALGAENYDESIVIVLSDANFDRYGISPIQFSKVIKNCSGFAFLINIIDTKN